MRRRLGKMLRVGVFLHRYLGMVLGVVMLLWCLSGVVMMYVPYPALHDAERQKSLLPLNGAACCHLPTALAEATLNPFQVEMLGATPILRTPLGDGHESLIDLNSGTYIERVPLVTAQAVAQRFGVIRGYQGVAAYLDEVTYDQWTVEGGIKRSGPFYRFGWHDDPKAPVLYVSSRTGRAMQITEKWERFWNWLGSIPHWIYFTPLRENTAAWTQVVVWTSIVGALLTLIGLYIGVTQWLRARTHGKPSPYHGIRFWHHIPGLIFGVLTLTWVVSGLVSMNPWGFLEGESGSLEPARVEGKAPSGIEVQDALKATSASFDGRSIVSVRSAPLAGSLHLLLTEASGEHLRLNSKGELSPLTATDLSYIRSALGGDATPAMQLLAKSDAYYFSHHRERVTLPVYRLIRSDAERTRFYVDPVSGQILAKVASAERGYRWLHQAPHRFDFIESKAGWYAMMLMLMAGVTFVCATGAILSITRWRKTLRT